MASVRLSEQRRTYILRQVSQMFTQQKNKIRAHVKSIAEGAKIETWRYVLEKPVVEDAVKTLLPLSFGGRMQSVYKEEPSTMIVLSTQSASFGNMVICHFQTDAPHVMVDGMRTNIDMESRGGGNYSDPNIPALNFEFSTEGEIRSYIYSAPGCKDYLPIERLIPNETKRYEFCNLLKRFEVVLKDEKTATAEIKEMLQKCNTLKQLLEIWPSALEFVDPKTREIHNTKVEKTPRAKREKIEMSNETLTAVVSARMITNT